MSAKKKHRTANEYLHYLKRELSGQDRHSFERDLEADPFLSEAMEGLEMLPGDQVEEDLLALHSRLRKRMARRRRTAIYSIAATVASLLIVGTIFLQVHDFNPATSGEETYIEEEETISTGKSAPEKESGVRAESQPALEPAENPDSHTAKEEVSKGESVTEREIPDAPAKSFAKAAEVKEADSEPIMHVEAEPVAAEVEEEAPVEIVETFQFADAGMEAAEREVRSDDAIIVEQSEMNNRDRKGRQNKRSEEPVAVSSREMQKNVLSQEEYVQPVVGEDMEPATAPGGASSATRPVDEKSGSISGWAEPAGGYEALNTYMEENMQFPADDTTTQRAVVILRFTVTVTGEITDITTLRSPGDSFTSEAVRLLKEGPSWNPASVDKGAVEEIVRIRMVFKK